MPSILVILSGRKISLNISKKNALSRKSFYSFLCGIAPLRDKPPSMPDIQNSVFGVIDFIHPQIAAPLYFLFTLPNKFCWFVLLINRPSTLKQQKNISLYWGCQLIGWSLAGLFWGFSAWVQVQGGGFGSRFSYALALLHFIFDIGIGILITHAYYRFAHKFNWVCLKVQKMPARLIRGH